MTKAEKKAELNEQNQELAEDIRKQAEEAVLKGKKLLVPQLLN